MTETSPAERPKRVLVVTENLSGGTGAHLVRMVGVWDPERWTAELLCFGRRIHVPLPGCPVNFAPAGGLLGRTPFVHLRNLLILRRAVKRFQPDVVHAYHFRPIMYARLLRRMGAIPHLVENRGDMGLAWSAMQHKALRLTRRVPDRVVCVADAVRNAVLDREGIGPGRVVTVRNGIPMPSLDGEWGEGTGEWEGEGDRVSGARAAAPAVYAIGQWGGGEVAAVKAELGFPKDALVVGMVSNLDSPVKRIDLFIRAVPRIAKTVPAARFLIVGQGRLRPELEALAGQLGVGDRVVFAGHKQDVGRYYRAMDVSVLTSISEGLSITLLESLAYGLPVVVTDVGGNREVAIDGQTGFLVPPWDGDAFADRVVELLEDEGLRWRFGLAGRQRIAAEFEIGLVADRYLGVYEEVLHVHEAPNSAPAQVAASR